MTLTTDQAARDLKLIMELKAGGATWDWVGMMLKMPPGPKRPQIAKKHAKECARVTQRLMAAKLGSS